MVQTSDSDILVGQQPKGFIYDKRLAQYRNLDTGQMVPRSHVLQLIEQEATRLEVRLAAHTRILATGKIELGEWQRRMATDIRLSHLRSSMLAAGGKEQMTPQLYGAVGYQVRLQLKFLHGFAQDLHQGKLTADKAIARAKLYGISSRPTFFRSEQLRLASNGTYVCKRLLDPVAEHCPECLLYVQPNWTPIDQVVPTGLNCSCKSRCKCRLIYRQIFS